MKPLRVCYYGMMAVWLFGGQLTGLRTFYIAFFAQLLLVLCCVAMNCWTYYSFNYQQSLTRHSAVRGETATLHIGIHNDKPFPFTTMRIAVSMVGVHDDRLLSFNLERRTSIAFDLAVPLPYRGEYLVGMTTMEVQDIFGLCPMRFRLSKLTSYRLEPLLVYPRLIQVPVPQSRTRDAKRSVGRPQTHQADADSYAHARPYQRGDSGRLIHWKLSMRQRELYTRQFDAPQDLLCLVFVDNARQTLPGEEETDMIYADAACEVAAAVIHHALRRGRVVETYDCAARDKPVSCRTTADFKAVYRWLAALPFEAELPVERALARHVRAGVGGAAVYVITRLLTAPLVGAMRRALTQGCSVNCVLLGEERQREDLPAGVRLFQARDGEELAGQMRTEGWL